MNGFQQSLPWIQTYWLQLTKAIKQQRIPQALLITGNKGLGKQALATYFAQSLLCFSRDSEGTFCGQCKSCQLFQAGTHPDYQLIEPEETEKSITISVIRALTTQLMLKPQFDAQRVVIINPADRLNIAAANAFLKYLEEPTERTTLILISENSAKLPATIRSRCQKLFISCPDQGDLESWLQQHNLSKNSEVIMRLSKGSPLLAKQFLENSVLTLRKQYFDNWTQLSCSNISFDAVAETWSKLDKTKMEFLLFCLISWVIDMIKLTYHQQALNLYNSDMTTDLKALAQKLGLTDLYQYYDFLLLSQHRLETQLNKQLLFEEILIKWLTLNNR